MKKTVIAMICGVLALSLTACEYAPASLTDGQIGAGR